MLLFVLCSLPALEAFACEVVTEAKLVVVAEVGFYRVQRTAIEQHRPVLHHNHAYRGFHVFFLSHSSFSCILWLILIHRLLILKNYSFKRGVFAFPAYLNNSSAVTVDVTISECALRSIGYTVTNVR